MLKMYIATLDQAPDYIVPTLVAHSVLSAHEYFKGNLVYEDWFLNSYRKVVVRVNQKEFDKIASTIDCWKGHENTICDARPSCLVCIPLKSDAVPNVLKFAKLWKPREDRNDPFS